MGSLWPARVMASRATASLTPPSSNRIRPGRTTATHSSGFPLPLPIRVSAGFLVTGLSGNTRIHSFPPRLMKRVMARRAASSCWLVTHARSRAWSPYSPKATKFPRWASPRIRPRWALRYFTLLGINMGLLPPLDRHAGHPRRHHDGLPGARPQLPGAAALGQDVPPVDPRLDPDPAVGGQGLGHPEVDVRPERLEGHAPLAVPLVPGDLGAGQPAAAGDADPLRPRPQAPGHRLLHGPPVGHPALQLARDVLGDQRGLQLRAADLLDVQLDLLAVIASSSFFRASMPVPPRPMMIPGRAECMVIRTRFAARSISTRAMPARASLPLMYRRMAWSSWMRSAKFFSAYHLDSQSLMIPSRSPIGWIFWPTGFPLYSSPATITVM